MTTLLILGPVLPSDLPIFFEQQLDSQANHIAVFTAWDSSFRAG